MREDIPEGSYDTEVVEEGDVSKLKRGARGSEDNPRRRITWDFSWLQGKRGEKRKRSVRGREYGDVEFLGARALLVPPSCQPSVKYCSLFLYPHAWSLLSTHFLSCSSWIIILTLYPSRIYSNTNVLEQKMYHKKKGKKPWTNRKHTTNYLFFKLKTNKIRLGETLYYLIESVRECWLFIEMKIYVEFEKYLLLCKNYL